MPAHAASGFVRQYAVGRHCGTQIAGSFSHGCGRARYASTCGATGSSSEIVPFSARRSAATAVNSFVVEPIGMRVCGVRGMRVRGRRGMRGVRGMRACGVSFEPVA